MESIHRGSYSINMCGNLEEDSRIKFPVEAIVNHNQKQMEIIFGAILRPSESGPSLGVDDIEIYVVN